MFVFNLLVAGACWLLPECGGTGHQERLHNAPGVVMGA